MSLYPKIQPTAELIETSFAENTILNRRQALKQFQESLQARPISDGLLAEYITDLFNDCNAVESVCHFVSQRRPVGIIKIHCTPVSTLAGFTERRGFVFGHFLLLVLCRHSVELRNLAK